MLVMDGVLICFWSQLSISGDRGILHEENSWSFMFRKFRFFVSIIFCAGSGIIQERECRVTLELDHDIDARSSCLPGDNEKIFEEVDGTCWLQVFRISIESLFLQSVCTF
ncbi:uncharacterized protein LOC132037947 isoform X9 [Lycium ferocissimum]|uniref:uncharacterized protein LOC132037947 isoform X9 n=1 Tax=Lycium ferocissimum TaxID=112874 RepID=UPI002814CE60|nr:uncharacterized protein LOC132037947 isoform X9 [Lycium ferocissimum]